ncbi:hypothetical protein Tco_1555920 [Tanacetum coccineum]
MNPVAAQQVALDNVLVAPEKQLKIKKCNARIEFNKPQREDTYQVTLDALKLSPCYPAFLITAEELGYSGKCDMLSAIHTDQMHQPWRTFAAIINRCISGKTTNFMFQADNRDISPARKEHMPYPRFTKVIISHFISKDKTISMRNMINLYTIRDDSLLGTLKFVSKTKDYQMYGALIPDEMINQDIKDSKAYKSYLSFATGQATPKKARKFKKVASPSNKLSPVLEEEPAKKPNQAKKPTKKSTTVPTTGVVMRDTPGVFVSKKKALAKVDRGKGIDLLFDVALLEAAQLKQTLKKSKQETHKLHASGLDDEVCSQPKVPDEQQDKTSGTNEGTDSKDDDSNNDNSDDVSKDDDDDVDSDADGDNATSDSEKTDSDEDKNASLNLKDDEEEEYEDKYVHTPEYDKFYDDEDEHVNEEEYEELYIDVNVNLKDAEHGEEGKRDR